MDELQLNSYFIGDTVTKSAYLTKYSPDVYDLAYDFGGTNQFAFTADGNRFAFSSPLTGITAGLHKYRVTATEKTTGSVTTLLTGTLNAIDLTSKSHAKRTLEAIEAMIEGRASSAQSEFVINGRQVRYFSHEELLKIRSVYKREVANEEAQERINAGLGSKNKILVRF